MSLWDEKQRARGTTTYFDPEAEALRDLVAKKDAKDIEYVRELEKSDAENELLRLRISAYAEFVADVRSILKMGYDSEDMLDALEELAADFKEP